MWMGGSRITVPAERDALPATVGPIRSAVATCNAEVFPTINADWEAHMIEKAAHPQRLPADQAVIDLY